MFKRITERQRQYEACAKYGGSDAYHDKCPYGSLWRVYPDASSVLIDVENIAPVTAVALTAHGAMRVANEERPNVDFIEPFNVKVLTRDEYCELKSISVIG